MASELRSCGVCGKPIRSAGGQPFPEGPVVCDNPDCQAELARSQAVNTPTETAIRIKRTK